VCPETARSIGFFLSLMSTVVLLRGQEPRFGSISGKPSIATGAKEAVARMDTRAARSHNMTSDNLN